VCYNGADVLAAPAFGRRRRRIGRTNAPFPGPGAPRAVAPPRAPGEAELARRHRPRAATRRRFARGAHRRPHRLGGAASLRRPAAREPEPRSCVYSGGGRHRRRARAGENAAAGRRPLRRRARCPGAADLRAGGAAVGRAAADRFGPQPRRQRPVDDAPSGSGEGPRPHGRCAARFLRRARPAAFGAEAAALSGRRRTGAGRGAAGRRARRGWPRPARRPDRRRVERGQGMASGALGGAGAAARGPRGPAGAARRPGRGGRGRGDRRGGESGSAAEPCRQNRFAARSGLGAGALRRGHRRRFRADAPGGRRGHPRGRLVRRHRSRPDRPRLGTGASGRFGSL
jgi:hypothetical protein